MVLTKNFEIEAQFVFPKKIQSVTRIPTQYNLLLLVYKYALSSFFGLFSNLGGPRGFR